MTVALLVFAAAIGSSARAEVAESDLIPTMYASFSPRLLHRVRFDPGALSLSTQLKTLDGSHVPALKEMVWEFDRNVRLDVSGLPVCPLPRIRTWFLPGPEKECTRGIVGRGEMQVEILFEESSQFVVESPVTVYNNGVRNGVPTLTAHAYITKPVPSGIDLHMELQPIHSEGFHTAMVVTVPKIAGGNGSITKLNMWLHRQASHHGERINLVSLRCLAGRIETRGIETFSDGTTLHEGAVRPCTAR